MKNQQILAISGAILLLAGLLVPIARLGQSFISIIPIWNNSRLYNGMWDWRDISFFAVTLMLLVLVSGGLLIREKYKGLIFTGFISLFSTLIIYAAIFIIQANLLASNTENFIISWGWLFLLSGSISLIISGARGFNKPHKTKN